MTTPEEQAEQVEQAVAKILLQRLLGEAPVEPRIWASLGTTIATRPYENVKIDIGISGVPVGATDEYIAELMKGANVSLQRVVDSLAEELARRIQNDFPER